ncbi:MAG: SemiSWEET family transporter [Hyphomonas sp.]|uniref:SemiSWEET family sugar transporter n=1 Tax=Hyphomonas sp. TaxID=87 RepID=UPI00349FE195
MQITPIELLGLVAGFFGTFAAAPQALKIIQTRQARGVSLVTYLFAATGGILWGLYGWLEVAPSIIFRNGVSLLMCASIIWLKLRGAGKRG